jgi:hypothetical protein
VFMGLIDNDQVLQFTVMLNNFKLQNFNLVRIFNMKYPLLF